ncbi:MAG: hypothetical protein FWG65_10590 [Turicibacter sp.]|nr:hypothetical protein [Turicibacter sp.]
MSGEQTLELIKNLENINVDEINFDDLSLDGIDVGELDLDEFTFGQQLVISMLEGLEHIRGKRKLKTTQMLMSIQVDDEVKEEFTEPPEVDDTWEKHDINRKIAKTRLFNERWGNLGCNDEDLERLQHSLLGELQHHPDRKRDGVCEMIFTYGEDDDDDLGIFYADYPQHDHVCLISVCNNLKMDDIPADERNLFQTLTTQIDDILAEKGELPFKTTHMRIRTRRKVENP